MCDSIKPECNIQFSYIRKELLDIKEAVCGENGLVINVDRLKQSKHMTDKLLFLATGALIPIIINLVIKYFS